MGENCREAARLICVLFLGSVPGFVSFR
jgi:hypothetical protein